MPNEKVCQNNILLEDELSCRCKEMTSVCLNTQGVRLQTLNFVPLLLDLLAGKLSPN